MTLTREQEAQVQKQLAAHRHRDYKVEIPLGLGHVLEGFKVNAGVFRSDKITSGFLLRSGSSSIMECIGVPVLLTWAAVLACRA